MVISLYLEICLLLAHTNGPNCPAKEDPGLYKATGKSQQAYKMDCIHGIKFSTKIQNSQGQNIPFQNQTKPLA